MTVYKEDKKSFDIKYLKVRQPLGDFYISSIAASKLVEITDFDVRRVLMEDRDVERYLGIQRPLNEKRVKEISDYVRTADACFPTGVIIAIPAKCVVINEDTSEMTISNFMDSEDESEIVIYRKIARVLDGQHRLAGLNGFGEMFEVNVCIFVDADIADQANIFSTVNLQQTKVNKSLAYDLYDLMQTRSPQKTCHNIAVTLDKEPDSPLYKMIKRLGVATLGRSNETLTQAAFVEPLLKMLSENPMKDRDCYLRHKKPEKISPEKLKKYPFQHLFIEERDYEITDIIWNFFTAVKLRWPNAWSSRDRGVILNKTNGYRALMRFLLYLFNNEFKPSQIPSTEQFTEIFSQIFIENNDFNIENFPPGSSGESAMFNVFINKKLF